MSINTGISPFWIIGFTVVGNPAATVIISSPGRSLLAPNFSEVSDVIANKLADEPELQRIACQTFINFARFV